MNDIKIENITIGTNHKPFVIAEMSGNHNQSLDRALELVDAAAEAGAHALKLQTYTADTITMKGAHTINDPNSLWNGKELHDLYKEAYTPWEWHKAIFDRAKEKGMIAFSSPFDETAVDFLESLNVPLYKIASFENTHHPLLAKVAKTGKPVIVSTGVATNTDIEESVKVLKDNGCKNIILLKCTSTYPATPENTNLVTIPDMINKYQCMIGLSDHTMGIGASVAAVALGARVIEKHFTLKRSDGGVDSAFSLEPEELKALVIETERAWLALGKVQYGVQAAEEKSLFFKRSIYISRDIKKGEIFSEENLKIIRPADGLAPKYWNEVIGKPASMDLTKGQPLKMDFIDKSKS
ncbi:MAG: N-acetylneuraminate synthase [Bacteroidetes bacterium]|jgi:pseudaminic acid synthase|nr:N-acetylneuraminate synthase [Bacteroidota bacterium]MDF2453755.1 N-acetylneuraminate synthase [Bacteroidota bacterium]